MRLQPFQDLGSSWGKVAATTGKCHPSASAEDPSASPCLQPLCPPAPTSTHPLTLRSVLGLGCGGVPGHSRVRRHQRVSYATPGRRDRGPGHLCGVTATRRRAHTQAGAFSAGLPMPSPLLGEGFQPSSASSCPPCSWAGLEGGEPTGR